MLKKRNELFLQIMEKIKTLNKKHELILEQFTNSIDRFIFDITEDEKESIFQNYIPLKHKAKILHNALAKGLDKTKNSLSTQEWIFMMPNFLVFGAFGFALALKTEENKDIIDTHVRHLFEDMTDTIYDLDVMLQEHFVNIESLDTIEQIMKKTKTKKTK